MCSKSASKHHLKLRWCWNIASSSHNALEQEDGAKLRRCLAIQCRLLNIVFVYEVLKGSGLVSGIFLVLVERCKCSSNGFYQR